MQIVSTHQSQSNNRNGKILTRPRFQISLSVNRGVHLEFLQSAFRDKTYNSGGKKDALREVCLKRMKYYFPPIFFFFFLSLTIIVLFDRIIRDLYH